MVFAGLVSPVGDFVSCHRRYFGVGGLVAFVRLLHFLVNNVEERPIYHRRVQGFSRGVKVV